MSAVPFRCADAAGDRGDPPIGTAPHTRRWLLVEHPGPWRLDAVGGSTLLGSVRSRLLRPPAQTRVLLMRRPGRDQATTEARRWALLDTGEEVRWGTWRDPSDLAEAADLLHGPPAPSPARSLDRAEPFEPLLLVCTHGVRDACCAIRGRPVAAALAESWPEATWECTHLGGDRFAPNLLVLPDGVLYGALDPATAVAVVRTHRSGRLALEHLRGFSSRPPVVQVAMATVYAELPDHPWRELDATAPIRVTASVWQVRVTRAGVPLATVTLSAASRPPALLTCRAAQATSAVDYRIEAVDLTVG